MHTGVCVGVGELKCNYVLMTFIAPFHVIMPLPLGAILRATTTQSVCVCVCVCVRLCSVDLKYLLLYMYGMLLTRRLHS